MRIIMPEYTASYYASSERGRVEGVHLHCSLFLYAGGGLLLILQSEHPPD